MTTGSEVYVRPDDLLRYVLQQSDIITDDQPLYTFLLGSRLCISPHQLLTNFQRIATSNDSSMAPSTGNRECAICRQRRKQPQGAHQGKTTSFFDEDKNNPLVGAGEETIRRRRRGRQQNDVTVPDPTSLVSRDSGIVSACFEDSPVIPAPIATHDVVHVCTCLRHRIVRVLHEWVRLFPGDFRNKKIKATLSDVIKTCQGDDDTLNEACQQVMDCMSRGIADQEKYERVLCKDDITMQDVARSYQMGHRKNHVVKFILAQKDATQVNEFARQLSLIELEYLKHVGAEELMQMFLQDGQEDTTRTNLGACVDWFNRVGNLVATVVCMCRKRKYARHAITFFLRVAERCYELSNYNSAMSIWTGLMKEPVTRLRRTWRKLKLTEYKKLEDIFSPVNNFREYRRIYAKSCHKLSTTSSVTSSMKSPTDHDAAVNQHPSNRFSIISQRSTESVTSTASQPGDSGVECEQLPDVVRKGSTSSESSSASSGDHEFNLTLPCGRSASPDDSTDELIIPCFTILIKDVYNLLHFTTPTTSNDGKINWEKLQRLSQILRPIEHWKRAKSDYQKDDEIQDFLLNTTLYTSEELFRASYKREAPSCRAERDNMKKLKAEHRSAGLGGGGSNTLKINDAAVVLRKVGGRRSKTL